MKAERMLENINNIQDAYIEEYAQKKPRLVAMGTREMPKVRMWQLASAAACLLLVMIFGFGFLRAQHPSRGAGAEYLDGINFGSYEKLMDLLPEDDVFRKIPIDHEKSWFDECWYYKGQDPSEYSSYEVIMFDSIWQNHKVCIGRRLISEDGYLNCIEKKYNDPDSVCYHINQTTSIGSTRIDYAPVSAAESSFCDFYLDGYMYGIDVWDSADTSYALEIAKIILSN